MVIAPELVAAWQRALEQWSQPVRHDTLLGLAVKHEQLAWLAGKYKDAAWSNPADRIAPERLARLRRAAAIVTFAKVQPEAEPARRPFRGLGVLLVGAMLATGLGLYLVDSKIPKHGDGSTVISRHP